MKDDNGNFLGFGDRLNFFVELGYWNPYYLSEIQPGNNTMARINGNTYVNINPIKGLNIRAAQAMEAFDYRTSGVALPMEPFKDAGTAKESFQRYYAFTYTNTAEYKFTAWDRNHFSFLLGQESIIRKNESFGVSVEGLTDTRLMLMSAGATPKMPSHSKNNTVFNSYFVTGSYNFDEKY